MSGEFDDFIRPPNARWTARVAPEVAAPAEPAEEIAVGTGYKAYSYTPADDLETCDVTWWLKGDIPQGQEIQYRFLIRICYLGDDQLQLMLTDCVLLIEGRNLRDLRKRLARRRVTSIQAYHPGKWPMPAESEPFIEKITALYPGEKVDGLGRQ